jgi:hypothetical protein
MMIPEKQEFSTSEVAQLAGSCERIINRFFDAKRLGGYRDKQDERRVPRGEVVQFFQRCGFASGVARSEVSER